MSARITPYRLLYVKQGPDGVNLLVRMSLSYTWESL